MEEESIAGTKTCSICRHSRRTPLAVYQPTINKQAACCLNLKLGSSKAVVISIYNIDNKKDTQLLSFDLAISFLRIAMLHIAEWSCLIGYHAYCWSSFIQRWHEGIAEVCVSYL